MSKKKSPILRLILAMIIGLFALEVMIELTTGTTLMGGRDGLFVSRVDDAFADAKVVNTPMKADMRVVKATHIHEIPTPHGQKVGKLATGTDLRVVGKTTVNDVVWYQVQRFSGKIGYVPGNTVTRR